MVVAEFAHVCPILLRDVSTITAMAGAGAGEGDSVRHAVIEQAIVDELRLVVRVDPDDRERKRPPDVHRPRVAALPSRQPNQLGEDPRLVGLVGAAIREYFLLRRACRCLIVSSTESGVTLARHHVESTRNLAKLSSHALDSTRIT